MNADPEQIRQDINAILAEMPGIERDSAEVSDADIDLLGRRLDEAHQVLVRALESVEKG